MRITLYHYGERFKNIISTITKAENDYFFFLIYYIQKKRKCLRGAKKWLKMETKINSKKVYQLIGCGYCIHEKTRPVRTPTVNKALQGCAEYRNVYDNETGKALINERDDLTVIASDGDLTIPERMTVFNLIATINKEIRDGLK